MNKFLEKIASTNIEIKPSHKGMLHKKMGVPEGKKISGSDLNKAKASAKASGDTKTLKEVVFAQNAKKWHHKKAEETRAQEKAMSKKQEASEKDDVKTYTEDIKKAKDPDVKKDLKYILDQEKHHAAIFAKELKKGK